MSKVWNPIFGTVKLDDIYRGECLGNVLYLYQDDNYHAGIAMRADIALCELVDAPEPWLAAPDGPGLWAVEGGYVWQPASTFRAVVEVVPEHRVLRVKSGLVVSNYVGKWRRVHVEWDAAQGQGGE